MAYSHLSPFYLLRFDPQTFISNIIALLTSKLTRYDPLTPLPGRVKVTFCFACTRHQYIVRDPCTSICKGRHQLGRIWKEEMAYDLGEPRTDTQSKEGTELRRRTMALKDFIFGNH